jgi:four helix bundle protein
LDGFKFEQLEVWSLSLEYLDLTYALADQLPKQEDYNLRAQVTRAATSVALNIAEGSTSQTDPEQARFLGLAIRSLIETVACRRVAHRRGFMKGDDLLAAEIEQLGQKLFAKLQAMRHSLTNDR